MSTENVTPHPALIRRSEARLGAVQSLYSFDINDPKPTASQLLLNIIQYYDEEQNNAEVKPDIDFMSGLIKGTVEGMEDIDLTIKDNLSDSWNLDRIGTVMRSILRVATYEILTHEKTPYKVLIDEYVKITTFYFDEKEVGFVNGILDKIAHNARGDEE